MDMEQAGAIISQIEWLTRINQDDFAAAFGFSSHRTAAWLFKKLLRPAARRFARQVVDFDQEVLELGLSAASREFLSTYVQEVVVTGLEYLPSTGPLLILSNHPGLTDTLALFANIPRPDLRVIALDRPFLRAMPETSRRMIFVPEDPRGRSEVIRSVARHLRRGGAVLTFPAGEIEPDPAYLPGSIESLENWSTSLALFARLSPEAQIVPAVVSAIYSPKALRHPLTYLRREPKDRETLAANLQILARSLSSRVWPVTPHVDFGCPIQAADLLALDDPALITRAVASRVQDMLAAVQPDPLRRLENQSQPER